MATEGLCQVKQVELRVALQNLPPAETVNQMLDNLNFLCSVMDDAFAHIQDRVQHHRSQISDITHRVAIVKTKTETISQFPNKATIISSANKYPSVSSASQSHSSSSSMIPTRKRVLNSGDVPLVNKVDRPLQQPNHNFRLSVSQRLTRPKYGDTLGLFKKLTEASEQAGRKAEDIRGIGRLPEWIESVSDCLLFDTDANPYLKYEEREMLAGGDGNRDKDDGSGGGSGLATTTSGTVGEENTLTEAPVSIAQKVSILDKSTNEFAIDYTPDLGDVPQFVADTTLSGLGGAVAFDVSWQDDSVGGFAMAPSAVNFDALPDLNMLPSMDDPGFGGASLSIDPSGFKPVTGSMGPSGGRSSTTNGGGGGGLTTTNDTLNGEPSLPKIGDDDEMTDSKKKKDKKRKKKKKDSSSKKGGSKKKGSSASRPIIKKKPAAAPIGGGEGRNALLDAIRNAKGGQGLKKSTRTRARKVKQKPALPRRMSLMDHLKARLDQRKKIMGGNTGGNSGGSSSAGSPKKSDTLPQLSSVDETAEDQGSSVIDDLLKSRSAAKEEADPMGLSKLHHMSKAMLYEDDPSASASDENDDWD